MEIGVAKWYVTKRDMLCQIESVFQDGSAIVISHYTGNRVRVDREDIQYFKEAEEPDTPAGTAIAVCAEVDEVFEGRCQEIYAKYPNIVPGSIYRVESTANKVVDKVVKENGRYTIQKDKHARGSTRCKVMCITKGCTGTRDVKVQEAYITKYCAVCAEKMKKIRSAEFVKKLKEKNYKNGLK